MKNRTPYFFLLLAVFAVLIGWWAWQPKAASPVVVTTVASAKVEAPRPTAESPPLSATPAKPSAVADQADALTVQTRIQRFQQALDAENSRPQDYYGKVMDQFGNPVAGATVMGNILLNVSFERSGRESHPTTTDADGLFQFTGLHGKDLGVTVRKEGYEMEARGKGFQGPANGAQPTPSDRAVFTLWKLSGAEPMLHTQLDSRVPYDGQSATFDLSAGKKSATGELRVTLTRTPAQVKRGVDHFDWNVRLEMASGGLVEAADAYKYLAPEAGYQAALVFAQSKNDSEWTQRLTKTFYLRTAKGQYGRVLIDLTMDSERADTGISIETWLNPSGSRNLEFDEAKQIKP